MYRIMAVLCFCICMATAVMADDWSQWRGPGRDGIWSEQGVIDSFTTPALPIKWRVPVGPGYNGPTVAQGRVFVMDRVTQPREQERVLCLDARTGTEIWRHTYACKYKKVGYPAGPRAAVTVDGAYAYAFGAMANLFCLNVADGKVVWQKDLLTAYQAKTPIWGFASSPLVYKDLLIVQTGGTNGACLVAFNKLTGQEQWRALDDKASYSSPIIIKQAGKEVLLCWTGNYVVGMSPETGRIHWQIPFKPRKMILNIADPVVHGNYVYFSAFYDGSLLIQLDQDSLSAQTVWRRIGKTEKITDALHCCISTPLIIGDYIYGVDSHGELRCLDLHTGDRVWESQAAVPRARWSNIHMVRQGERFWFFNERGELIICRLSPQGYHEISRAKLIDPTTEQLKQRDGVCWSHPAYANRCVFARNDKELVCADLSR
jgi:outer membrane protein assembly factor BamB